MTDKGPMVPAFVPAWTKAGQYEVKIEAPTPPTKWLVVVPMADTPRVESYKDVAEIQARMAELVEDKETGWVFVFEGEQYPIRFSKASAVTLAGQEQLLGPIEEGDVGVLPGTELYPKNAE